MKYDIEALKRKMLVKYPFFGSVVANVKYKEERNIETAGTDGEILYYNPDFLENLSTDEQIFIFAHEVCHIAFNHILRSEGKNAQIWNIATDAVINQFLKKDGLKIVEGGVDMPDAINYDAEQLYDKMMQEQEIQKNQSGLGNGQQSQNKEQQQSQSDLGNGQQDQNKEQQNVGHDTHNLWEEAVKKHKKEQEKTEIKKKQEELEKLGEKDAFKKNRNEKKQQLEELKQAIAKQALAPGNSTNSNIRTVSDIGIAKPLIDWRYILRETITYNVDWSYKNATIEDGVLTAHLEKIPMPETEIVLDTSGSINKVLLKNFLRECKNILKQSRVKVGCFDTEFYGFHDIRTEKDIENMEFRGGGGTNFNVAIGAFSRRVENKIIFTDGEAFMPDVSINAIWIVFGNKKINPKGGKVINITGKQLDKLYSYKMDIPSKGRTR